MNQKSALTAFMGPNIYVSETLVSTQDAETHTPCSPFVPRSYFSSRARGPKTPQSRQPRLASDEWLEWAVLCLCAQN